MSEISNETGEVREAEKTSGDVGGEVDEDFAAELDSTYRSRVEGDGAIESEEKEIEEVPPPEGEEGEEDITAELDEKYNECVTEVNEDAETDFDRKELQKETGWSDAVVENIENEEQAEIYKNADLHPATVDGRECLVKEIDMDYVDPKTGMTNRELMSKGRSPYDAKTGEKIELHHMGQGFDAPFAELTENSEHGNGNHSTLHPKTEGSWRNDKELEREYQRQKKAHWKARSEEA